MFYVYEWFNVDTGYIFYVGKGTGKRYRVRQRNKTFNNYIKNNNCSVRIVEYFENELECFKKEEQRINELMAIGQCCCNRVYGGNGGVKSVWTKEMREKMSKDNPMHDKEQRKRMSNNNPMKRADVAYKVGQSKRIKFTINGIYFNGLEEAAKRYNVSITTISKWVRIGKTSKGEAISKVNPLIPNIPINKEECYIIFKNNKYKTITELCKKENLKYDTVYRWLKKGFSSNGEYIRYSNDNKEYVFTPTSHITRNKPVIVNGEYFKSIIDASKYLNITEETLCRLLKGKNTYKCKNVICKYVNQQPSCGKSDNSTTKGSTTNE